MVLYDTKKQQILFVCHAQPGTKRVCLVGTFNDWQADRKRMTKVKDGSFRARLSLAPGRYEYKFVVDGQWLPDADAVEQVTNPFGSANSVAIVPEAGCGPDCCCCDE